MTDRRDQILIGAAATVIGGTILTGISWAFGKLPALWNFVVAVATGVWAFLSYRIGVPLGLLALGLLALAIAGSRLLLRHQGIGVRAASSGRGSEWSDPDGLRLSETERRVVEVLAALDGQYAQIDHISDTLRLPRLLVEQALENLHSKDLLYINLNYVSGASCRLSAKGRDLAIERGLVPSSKPR